jgi:endonuclease G
MKKFLLSIVLAVTAITAQAWDQRAPFNPSQCGHHTPYGMPQTNKIVDGTLLCRPGYFILHDNANKIPAWGAWEVRADRVNGCWPRTNAFTADRALGSKSARPNDYAGTGYDKGHLANDAHQSWDEMVEYESFLMSNMMPQLPGLNRGIWKLLETATGAWSFSRQTILIVYAGPIYRGNEKRIGNGVLVPVGFYKIIIDRRTNEVLAFIFPHAENQGNDLTKVQTTVAQVEQYTGISFAVPGDKNAKLPIWPVDFKSVADNKRAVCKR